MFFADSTNFKFLTKNHRSNSKSKHANTNTNIASDSIHSNKIHDYPVNFDKELNAPIFKLDMEEWIDMFNEESHSNDEYEKNENKENSSSSNLIESVEICSSLEDLVKTFDQNVKKCLSNYKDIDIGQLAPVQVRTQEQLMNESQ
jgi:hypothetical protein